MRKKRKGKIKEFKKNSLFKRYFGFTISLVVVMLLLLATLIVVITSVQWWNEKTQALTRNAEDMVQMIHSLELDSNFDNAKSLEFFRDSLEIVSNATLSDYYLVGNDGRVVVCKECSKITEDSDCEIHGKLRITEFYMERAKTNAFADYAGDNVFGYGKFVAAVPVTANGEAIGAIFAVEDAITGLLPYVLNIIRTIFFATIGAILLCFIVIFFFARGITTPLNEMKEVTKHFAKGEFTHRANENYKSIYFGEFAKALNKMADELAIDEEAQRSFIANVSHELKTPMTTIGGFIDGILDGTIPKEQEHDYLTVVSSEVKRLSRIVVSMLNLSKIEAGEVSISLKEYDISAQIFETLLPFERIIIEKGIAIEGFEDMGTVYVNADRDLIQQVIYNLLDNAVKFTPEKGTINIHADSNEDRTYVRIRNTGAGVSNDEISRIFERFYKVDKSRSFDVKGVGLGLYIVKTIINMHDGEITASSEEGKYTEFAFEIPNN